MNSKIVAVIPARGGSKGVPGKNIRLINGEPLLAYSIKAALNCKSIGRTILSTDSPEIADVGRKYGAEVPFLRPKELATDSSPDLDFVLHLLDWLDKNEKVRPDFLVHLRPTTPLRDPVLMEEAIQRILHREDATALRSVHEMSETAYKCLELSEEGLLKTVFHGKFDLEAANVRRQDLPKTYSANGYVDVLRVSQVLTNKKMHGDKVLSYTTPNSVEVDTFADLEYLEYSLGKNKDIFKKLFQ